MMNTLALLNGTQSDLFCVFILCTDHVAKCFEKRMCVYLCEFKLLSRKMYKEQKCRRGQFFFLPLLLAFVKKKKNTFQLERRVAEVQLPQLSPFPYVGKWTIFYFLLLSLLSTSFAQCWWLWQTLTCTGEFYSWCYDIIVVLHHL